MKKVVCMLCLCMTVLFAFAQQKNQFTHFDMMGADGKMHNTSEYVGKGNYVLVDFWATWCGPCMRQAPIVEELAAEGYSVGKVDVDQQPDLAGQYGVMSIPTLIVFKGGKEVHRVVGLTAKNDLKRLLDE